MEQLLTSAAERRGRDADLFATQWNMGVGGLADKKRDFGAIWEDAQPDIVSINEGADQEAFKRWVVKEFPLRLLEGKQLGMPSTPMLVSRRRFNVLKPIRISLPSLPGEKPKWCCGARLYDEEAERLLDAVNMHAYHKQRQAARRQAVNQALRQIDDFFEDRRVSTLLLADLNRVAQEAKPYLSKDWECDQLTLKPVVTHGRNWKPDQVWLRDGRKGWKFIQHWTTPGTKNNKTDHMPLNVALRPI